MARSISTIKSDIGNYYISQPDVQSAYGITQADAAQGFDACFSKVSIENLLFYAIAFCINVFEQILDLFKTEIETEIATNYIANKAWWHMVALAFQKGYNLTMNAKTFIYEYGMIDTSAQIIKRHAIRENTDQITGVCKVHHYVVGETSGALAALTSSDLALFDAYMQMQRPSGVLVECHSGAADTVDLDLTIDYNPLLIDSTGILINDGLTKPVDEAVQTYIDTLNDETDFGGNFNITKLLNQIEVAIGVVDLEVTAFKINGVSNSVWGTFASTNGWFTLGTLTVTYQPHIS